MGNTLSSRLTRIDWLAKGPRAPHVDAYKQYLTDRGYAATTFANCIRCVAHFAQWVHGRRLPIRRIDEAAVAEFLDDHLPRCRCAGPVQRDRRNLSAALGHLLTILVLPFNVIALWLGHESTTTTHRYVEADLAMKEKALARLEAPDTKMRRFRAPDSLMRFLNTL